MKNREKNLKTAMMISLVTLLALLAGVVMEFVKTGQFDAQGCGLLACNTAIYSSCLLAYQKCRKTAGNVQ